ncbi:Uma2 family endonuclease [Nodosilinea sp. LEGE 06152]|uniref:Uma2 family endonuclease n=1 Tax=Nodosilinea sp. LEGE 06152 TaxID=2777966 RepID=UPI00187E3AEE|nr:Uma2 family endonuclease [Nodosilinea sp. LEGE 06152]MBE9159611.1 Uma2 family endonuclease [Nodosilinea sp. LEGE 06152]
MATLLQSPSQHITLQRVSWSTYQALLQDMGDHRAARLAYDQGTLEIIMPSDLHEVLNRLLDRIITALTEELDLKIKAYGSTTLEREDLEQGVEPDSCYYIQNADQISTLQLDLRTNPPPDLAVEVDITSSAQRRFTIYQQLQIPEVWQYTQRRGLVFYALVGGQYVECEVSPTFPQVSSQMLVTFLQMAPGEDDNAVVKSLRRWIRQQSS